MKEKSWNSRKPVNNRWKTNEERRAHAINVKLLQETGKLVSEPNGAIKTKRKRPMEKNVTRFQASVR